MCHHASDWLRQKGLHCHLASIQVCHQKVHDYCICFLKSIVSRSTAHITNDWLRDPATSTPRTPMFNTNGPSGKVSAHPTTTTTCRNANLIDRLRLPSSTADYACTFEVHPGWAVLAATVSQRRAPCSTESQRQPCNVPRDPARASEPSSDEPMPPNVKVVVLSR